jgi:hypothetical protein
MPANGNMEDAIHRSKAERKEIKGDYTDDLERSPDHEHQDQRPEGNSGSLPSVSPP